MFPRSPTPYNCKMGGVAHNCKAVFFYNNGFFLQLLVWGGGGKGDLDSFAQGGRGVGAGRSRLVLMHVACAVIRGMKSSVLLQGQVAQESHSCGIPKSKHSFV